jgi:hypothetical protein
MTGFAVLVPHLHKGTSCVRRSGWRRDLRRSALTLAIARAPGSRRPEGSVISCPRQDPKVTEAE